MGEENDTTVLISAERKWGLSRLLEVIGCTLAGTASQEHR